MAAMMRQGIVGVGFVLAACGGGPRGQGTSMQVSTTIGASSASDGGSDTAELTQGDDGGSMPDEKLDAPPDGPGGGCNAIDFLFVIDNSQSMRTYQMGLAEQFPDFIDAMFEAVPPGIDMHVGITTTDFDANCSDAEATQGCQSTATLEEVQAHYRTPDTDNDGGNGTQGRLFRYADLPYFQISSDDDPAPLVDWFSEAAVAAGEDGCSFEMPVAAAGWMASPANAEANAGFLRDELALLVVFVLTDEPDKSVESTAVYKQMILDGKPTCGGEACIFTSALFPSCVPEVNQKLWQFLVLFGNEAPPWGDISMTSDYSDVFGTALADAIAQACLEIPIP
jgi:hypothetical protein